MSLKHEFILLQNNSTIKKRYFDFRDYYSGDAYKMLESITLNDDFLAYILDCLSWCDTILPDGDHKTDFKGLSRFGVTEIIDTQAFKRLIDAWVSLIALAPVNFTLRGEFERQDGEFSTGDYAKIDICRDDLISDLKNLSKMCTIHIQNPFDLHFVHLGI